MQSNTLARTFVLGDIHGAYRALRQCLERARFDYNNDHLICLGDVCDGWPETKGAIDELLTIKNLTYLFGNHDFWAREWMKSGNCDAVWLDQGGQTTVDSYNQGIPQQHIDFFDRANAYFLLYDKLFVHAGIDPGKPVELQGLNILLWDRSLARIALDCYKQGIEKNLSTYQEIYVGHTPIPFGKPTRACNVWLMDTGAGWSGVLSMMDIKTKEVFQSDAVPTLYPGVEGRKKRH